MKNWFAKKKWLIPALSALLLIGSAGAAAEGTANAASKKTITVNIALNAGLTPITIAKEKGWLEQEFAKYNAKISWSEFPSGPPLLEALAAKRVDLSFLGDGAALTGQSNGLPFKNIALLSDGGSANTLLVPTGSKIKSVKDLKGKTIALAKGTTSHVFLLKLLAKNGLKEKDVKIVNLQFADGLPAFSSGKVDAWQTIEPYVTQLTLQKKATVLAGADQKILAPVTIIARNAFAKDHPELVTAFLSVYKKAADYTKKNQDEVANIFSKQKNVPVPIVKALLNSQNAQLSPVTKQAIDAQQASADLLYEAKFLKKKIKYTDYVDNSFVNKIK